MEDLKQRKKNLIMFPLGTVGRDMIYYLFTSCIITFVLFTRNLTNAQFGAITAIVVAARIFDALNDPIMGNIIERTRTRWGKFKPWLVIGILSTSVVVYLAFNTDLQGWSARNQFASRATLFAGIGGTLASVLIPMFTVGDMAIGGSTTVAYGKIALIICIIAPLFLCFTIFGVRENREYTDAPPISFKKIWTTITGNDQLLWISLIFLLQQIGNGLIVGGIGSTYIYFDFGYEGGLFSLFSIVGMSVTAFLMIFYPAISRHIKRKKLMTILACISMVGYAMMLVAGLALPSTMLKFWIVTIGYALSNFGQYGYYLIMMISIINTVEYNEYRTGSRDEAIITSLRPFLTKMSSALIVLVTNLSYIIFGVTKYTNQISDFENECARNLISEQDKIMAIDNVIAGIEPGKTLALLLCMVIVPCVLMLLSYFLYKKHYKLDEDEYDRICSEIAARKEAKA